MKLTTFLLFLATFQLTANVYSQTTRLNLKYKSCSLAEIIEAIENQSDYKIFYKTDQVDIHKMVDISDNDKSVASVLNQALAGSDVTYRVLDKLIVLTSVKNESQQLKVSGIITDATNGELLVGVNVVVEGTTVGTISDANGKYSIEIPSANAVLVFSYIGYNTERVSVEGKSSIDMRLIADITKLEEIVVVGYGTQKKSDITGSVSSVSKARLSQLPVTNVMQAIEGSVAGVNISQTSSVPGSTTTASIRGINSINANTSPFIVVDGMPFNGSTNDINPNDISSIEILKDASAVAIYGTRGANGVILITTKRGESSKPVIKYNGYAGYENLTHILKPMDGPSYVQKWADYNAQAAKTPKYAVPNVGELDNYNAGKTTDWIKEATQQGYFQDHNINLTGGTKDVSYFISGDYLNQEGVVKGYQYHRASVRSNLDIVVTDFLKVGSSMFFSTNNYDGGRANLLNASAMSPYASVKDAKGNYIIFPMNPEQLYSNPLLGLVTDRIDRNSNINGNFYGEITPTFLKGLKYRANASYSYIPSRYADYTGRAANNNIGLANSRDTENKTWVLENILTYTKDIDKHHFDLTGLYSAQATDYFASAFGSSNFINDELSFNAMGAGSTVNAGTIPDPNSSGNASSTGTYSYHSALLSQMLRLNYSYDSRYLITLTARRDGYSAFGANTDKYGMFPSFAIGWNVNKESFLKDVSVIDNLKIRASLGRVGNQAIGPNQTSSVDATVLYPFSGASTVGVLSTTLGNPNLNWESTTASNIGLDFSGWNRRVNLTVDLYKTDTKGILLKRNIPQISGYTWLWDNLGEMQNTGIEITLNTINISTENFKWESNLNFATNKNKLLDLYGDKKSDRGNRWFIGQPIGVIFDYEKIGVWQVGEDPSGSDPTAKPGDLKFRDQLTVDSDGDGKPDKGDGIINDADKTIQGSTSPKWRGGFTNTFSYKNFRLNIFIQTTQGALKNDPDLNYADEQSRRNTPAEIGYWTATNKSNDRPSLIYNNTRGYGYPKNNSYTRIKDITLSYNFSKSLFEGSKIEGMNIYVSGRNLHTFTNWVGWDPENNYDTRGSGNWVNNYPNTRTIVFGLNISLR